ncbi:MAG: galactokinase [Demequinaceae bacterium]|nr:galactokinase [Demequinaceae bacterium]
MNASSPEPRWYEPWARASGEARAQQCFADHFGEAAAGVWSAPGRVNLIGEHTDYNFGLALPTIIRHRTFVAASVRDDDDLVIVSSGGEDIVGPGKRWQGPMDDITPESTDGWPAYPAGLVWALRERGYDGPGLNLAFSSSIPIGAGLASSAALTCSTAMAVNALWRLALDSDERHIELAEAAMDAENLMAKTPTGGLDQYTSLFCREGSAIEIDFSTSPPTFRPTPLYFPDYGLALLVIVTPKRHRLTDGRYAQRYDECQQASKALGVQSLREVADDPHGLRRVEGLSEEVLKKRARHVVSEIERVRLVSEELAGTAPAHERFVDIGRQIYRSHTSLAVDFEVSCAELDLAVNAAWTSGALGARLVGGGFGGAAIALVRRTQMDATARLIDQSFMDAGMERPGFLVS